MPDKISHEQLHWHSNGQSSLTGSLWNLFQNLDSQFVQIASHYQAEEHKFPIFVSARELQKIGYLSSFPHHATFPVVLDDAHENLEQLASGDPLDEHGCVKLAKTAPVENLLTPAACYHFYIQFQDRVLDAPLYLTTVANCFRREKHYSPLQRQWNFNMREIVCVGSMDEVQTFLKDCRERVTAFIDSLGLKIEWEIATDPFFNPSKNPKYLMQKLEPSKSEIVYDKTLAIGSVNFHRNYFGEAYSIRREDQEAYSGCVAFGLERWVAAIVDQFGPDSKDWPRQLRSKGESA